MDGRARLERTPDGYRLVTGRRVEAPAPDVWDLLVDTTRWPDWGPSVSAVECDDRRIRTGSTGRVRTAGVWLPFTVTACRNYRWTWRIGPVPATGHRVTPGDGSATVAFEVPIPAAPYLVVCRVALRRIDRLATGP